MFQGEGGDVGENSTSANRDGGVNKGYVWVVLEFQMVSKHLGLHKSSQRCSRCRTCCSRGNRTSTHTRAPGVIDRDYLCIGIVDRLGGGDKIIGRLWGCGTREQVLTSSASLQTWVSASNTLPSEQPNLFGSCKGHHHCHIPCYPYAHLHVHVPSYRVLFFTGTPLKSLKYKKDNLG